MFQNLLFRKIILNLMQKKSIKVVPHITHVHIVITYINILGNPRRPLVKITLQQLIPSANKRKTTSIKVKNQKIFVELKTPFVTITRYIPSNSSNRTVDSLGNLFTLIILQKVTKNVKLK